MAQVFSVIHLYSKTYLQGTLWWQDTCYFGTLLISTDKFSTVNTLWSGDTCRTWTADRQIAKFSVRYLEWGDSLQVVNAHSLVIFTVRALVLLWNLPCGSAWMIETELEVMHEHKSIFQHRRVFVDKRWPLNLPIVFSIFDQLLPLHEKNGIQKKNYIRAEGSSHESAGQWLFMQRCCTEVQVWKVVKSKQVIFTAKFHVYVHTFTFYLAYSGL